jgi:hypothetical protein
MIYNYYDNTKFKLSVVISQKWFCLANGTLASGVRGQFFFFLMLVSFSCKIVMLKENRTAYRSHTMFS